MKIQVFPLEWEGGKRIGIRPMGFDKAFPGMMKQVRGSRWTPDVRCWHIPYDPEAYGHLKRLFGEGQVRALTERSMEEKRKIKEAGEKQRSLEFGDQLIRLEERLRLQRYSYNTVKTYKNFFAQFLSYYPDRNPEELKEKEILQLFEVVTNMKHRTVLMLIYSAGLRIGESIRLRDCFKTLQNADFTATLHLFF